MPWKKKKSGAQPILKFKIESLTRNIAEDFCAEKAAAGWFVNCVVPDGPTNVLVTSCKKSWPKKPKADPKAEVSAD